MASRLVLKKVLEKIRTRGRNLRNILIVGTNGRALRMVDRILKKPEFGYQVMGFVDEGRGMKGFEKSGHHLVADFNSLPALLRTAVIDEVAICLPIKSYYQQISQIVSDCEKQGIMVRFLSDIFNLKLGRVKPEEFDEGAFHHRFHRADGRVPLAGQVWDGFHRFAGIAGSFIPALAGGGPAD